MMDGPILGDTLTIDFCTRNDDGTGEADADSTPDVTVYEDATDAAIVTATVAKRVGTTGHYRTQFGATAGNGFEVGKSYNVKARATVGGVTDQVIVGSFVLAGQRTGDLNTDAVDADALAADAVAEMQSGLSTLTAQQVWEYANRILTSYIAGDYVLTCTVEDGDAAAIGGISVWLEDASGNLRSPPQETNGSGQVSWNVPNGAWTVYIQSTPAYAWDASSKTTTINGADGSATFTGTAWSAPVPTTSEYCVLYGYVKDLSGTSLASETDAIRVVPDGQYRNGNTGMQSESESADTNAAGYFEVEVLRSKYLCSGTEASGSGTGTVKLFIDKAGIEKSGVTIPDQSSKDIWDLIRGV